MFNKLVIFILAYFLVLPVIAGNSDELALPPEIQPEEFDRPVKQPKDELTLRDAVALTLESSPELATFAWALRAREIDRIKAGLLPNPEASLEVEDFAGSGPKNKFEETETTIALSQLIELGGKRMKRVQLAVTEKNLARWDYEVKRMDLLAQAAGAFINVLGAQQNLAILGDVNDLSTEIYNTVQKRVEAGKVSPLDEIKARVELSKSRLNLLSAEKQLNIARHILASNWGSTEATFTRAAGEFDRISAPPALESIVSSINNNPDLARWVTEMSQRQDTIDLARANTIPDITVSAGIRRFSEIDEFAAVASISVPLFLFDNKQTGVQRSETEFNLARKEKEATETRIRTQLQKAYRELQILYNEVTALRDEIMPGAEAAFKATKKAYELGKLGLLDLLDAQRTYFDIRQQLIEATRQYHFAVNSVERLTGTSIFNNHEYMNRENLK